MIDVNRHNMKAAARAKLREDYEAWRAHPFTELFLSYLDASAAAYKDMAVEPDAGNRDIIAAKHNTCKAIAAAPDQVYRQADENIELRFLKEELADDERINAAAKNTTTDAAGYPRRVQSDERDSGGDTPI